MYWGEKRKIYFITRSATCCFLNYPSLLRYWLSLRRIASVLHVLISRMQHEVTNVTPSATSATHEEAIHPRKLQQMLELHHLYWKALSSWYAKSDTLLLGGEAWSSASLETYLGLDIWSGMQIFFVCSPVGISYKDLQGTKASVWRSAI